MIGGVTIGFPVKIHFVEDSITVYGNSRVYKNVVEVPFAVASGVKMIEALFYDMSELCDILCIFDAWYRHENLIGNRALDGVKISGDDVRSALGNGGNPLVYDFGAFVFSDLSAMVKVRVEYKKGRAVFLQFGPKAESLVH